MDNNFVNVFKLPFFLPFTSSGNLIIVFKNQNIFHLFFFMQGISSIMVKEEQLKNVYQHVVIHHLVMLPL